MSARFQDQVIIVTGAIGGIGSAIVEGFLAEGGKVGLIDFNSQGGQAYEKELKKRGHAV
ncbi:SDR family NAD(P)-dependent oxidoreductase, partial [Achromobacter xylosoxidans]|nr:SDR family NAD(P)-dependent oxidoreductase [Achromobacter xylosoxidans]